jgi:hypothetical protein
MNTYCIVVDIIVTRMNQVAVQSRMGGGCAGSR